MLENLKEAFARPHALTQNKNWGLINRDKLATYRWDLYPLLSEYYHEFNPFHVHAIPPAEAPALMPDFPVFTIRDGAVFFAEFLISFAKDIPKWKTLFLIPPEFAALVPQNLRAYFLSYQYSQVNRPDFSSAKSVTVFGHIFEQYFGGSERLKKKLALLEQVPAGTKVDVLLTGRKSLYDDRESLNWIQVPELVRKHTGHLDLRWMKSSELLGKSLMKGGILLDLSADRSIVGDSYLDFWCLTRGGAVHGMPTKKPEGESLFELDVSFFHKLHVLPLPPAPDHFSDILFYSKTNRGPFWNSAQFHVLVSDLISGKNQ